MEEPGAARAIGGAKTLIEYLLGGVVEIQTRKEKVAVVVSVKGRMDAVTAPELDPFDMTSLPAPDLPPSIEERRIGGLGIFLIRKMVDDVRCRREGNFNMLNLIIQRGEEK